jgi:hypothetical protein
VSRPAALRRGRGDDGFTLIDTVLAVGLTTTIMGVLAAAIMVTLGPDQDALERSASSHAAQMASLWLPADLASAGPVDAVADLAPGAPLTCTGTTAGTNVLRLGWNQPVPQSTNTAISYRVVHAGADWQLVRYACTNGGPVSSHVIVEQLSGPAAVTVGFRGARQVTVGFTTAQGEPVSIGAARRTPGAGTTSTVVPTTTTAPTTTTTTTVPTTTVPTTTTTTVPCSVSEVAPASFVWRTASRTLAFDVGVTVTTSGSCSGLRLSFVPDGGAATVLSLSQANGSTWTATIPGSGSSGAETWTSGTKTLSVLPASGSTPFATTGSLWVIL